MNLAFYWFKDMDLVEQVHIFGLSNIHTHGSNIRLNRVFSPIFNDAKPRIASGPLYMYHSTIDNQSFNFLMVLAHALT